jgi:hypothetical protein
MFTEGAKDIIVNQMHARIPNSIIKRNQWLNLCIDMQSFMNECFGKQSTGGSVNGGPGSVSTSQINGQMSPSIPQNIYKSLEQIQIEGHVRIRKIFSSRS